jgi:hypothetical protein
MSSSIVRVKGHAARLQTGQATKAGESRCAFCHASVEWPTERDGKPPLEPGTRKRHVCKQNSPVKVTRLTPEEMAELGWTRRRKS